MEDTNNSNQEVDPIVVTDNEEDVDLPTPEQHEEVASLEVAFHLLQL